MVYVSHEVIRDYNACYRVIYKGKLIHPPAAERLGIPINEIWISELLKHYEPYSAMEELSRIKGIGKKRLSILKENFWCLEEEIYVCKSEEEQG